MLTAACAQSCFQFLSKHTQVLFLIIISSFLHAVPLRVAHPLHRHCSMDDCCCLCVQLFCFTDITTGTNAAARMRGIITDDVMSVFRKEEKSWPSSHGDFGNLAYTIPDTSKCSLNSQSVKTLSILRQSKFSQFSISQRSLTSPSVKTLSILHQSNLSLFSISHCMLIFHYRFDDVKMRLCHLL